MVACGSCFKEIPADSRLCPYCGAGVVSAGVAATLPAATLPARPPPATTPSDSIDEARFTPGTMLEARYRIVGLLGRGGMGEVYRADDLKLRQAVAIKFLPAGLAGDERKLERFDHEVRIARHVSHPNVCRVYDIGEADGHHFITMEYVDGEDLARVLRRMGRPSKDKALEIARQICAGLAAAHDKGVLHRDLKPHNVMIDGQGRVRITDFGLAGFVDGFAGKEICAGTPAYMAPEQLAGQGVSVKSDLYALGLILCELFTGKRVIESGVRQQVSTSGSLGAMSLSSLADDIDPAVERVILRCLSKEPADRPSSALAIAAALPGGDPLAAALAAGETPSPEMVANAGEVGGLRPAVAFSCLATILIGTVVLIGFAKPMYRYVPLPKPPEALAERGAEILRKVGHTAPVADTAFGFDGFSSYCKYVEKEFRADRLEVIRSRRPAAIEFWYRQSPKPLIPPPSEARVSSHSNPPLDIPGMSSVVLDPLGRLVSLTVLPVDFVAAAGPEVPLADPDWPTLFKEAELHMSDFRPAVPEWTPTVYCDQRAAWEGRFPNQTEPPLRVEAGAFRGRPVYFRIIGPWTKPSRIEISPRAWEDIVQEAIMLPLVIAVVIGSLLLALRNVRLRRGDRAGANRLAVVYFLLFLISYLLWTTHVMAAGAEFWRLVLIVAQALFASCTLWLLYMALEPYIRRRWPQVLISWSRLLAGRFRDPLIGRDILIGGVAGIVAGLVDKCRIPLAWMGAPPTIPWLPDPSSFLGGRYCLGILMDPTGLWLLLFLLFVLFVLRALLRRQWLAVAALLVLFIAPSLVAPLSEQRWASALIDGVVETLMFALVPVVLVRFGLVAGLALMLTASTRWVAPTLDLTAWYSGGTFLVFGFFVLIYGYGCYISLAGRPLFRDELTNA